VTDTLAPEQRSARMALVRSKNTKPELQVRRVLHSSGLRYRLHQRIAGARPDIVFPSRRIAVMVNGCMWHQHPDPNCKLARMPKSRLNFWRPKLEGNARRDTVKAAALKNAGWKVITVWECEITNAARLAAIVEEIRLAPQQAAASKRRGF
jgi:DNA mismatch endonuclease (patch repair protein)